jgi:hypothetical protein
METSRFWRLGRRGNGHRQVSVSGPSVSVRQTAEGNAFRQVAIPEFNA